MTPEPWPGFTQVQRHARARSRAAFVRIASHIALGALAGGGFVMILVNYGVIVR